VVEKNISSHLSLDYMFITFTLERYRHKEGVEVKVCSVAELAALRIMLFL
jgi:hypothetical protein